MTQPVGSGAPPFGDSSVLTIQPPSDNLIITPQIGEPQFAGENPDFTADYIFCNNLFITGTINQSTTINVGVIATPQTFRIWEFNNPATGFGSYFQIQARNSEWYLEPVYIPPGGDIRPVHLTSTSMLRLAEGLTGQHVAPAGIVFGNGDTDLWEITDFNGNLIPWGNRDIGAPNRLVRNIFVGIAGAVANRTKAGTPVDADVNTPTDGMMIIDTTASKIWVRIGGVWKQTVALT